MKLISILPLSVRFKIRHLLSGWLLTDHREEPHDVIKKRVDFYKTFIQPGDLCFDIGANAGNRTKAFLLCGAKVVAVEPQQELCVYMKSKFNKNATILNLGVGEHASTQQLYKNKADALSSFSLDWIQKMKQTRFASGEWIKSDEIQITTLDLLIKKFGKPTFIKIDTEGFELPILQGLSQPIDWISFEYTTPEMNKELIACLHQVSEISPNYHYNYSVGESMEFAMPNWVSLTDMIDIVASPSFHTTNFGDIYCRL